MSLLTKYKYILSFLKSDWTLKDYPVVFIQADPDAPSCPGLCAAPPWTASIAGWFPMFGFGETKEEAYADLQRQFGNYKAGGGTLPRPGTIKFPESAPTTELDSYDELVDDFIEKILELDPSTCWITDWSSLGEFIFKTDEEYKQKIAEVYGVDVSDIESGNLVEILQRIRENQKSA